MPYKNIEKQRNWQLIWIKKRRIQWLTQNGPCKQCGSWKQLEVDHIKPETKINHRIWSWAKARRLKELAKCQVLCKKCHRIKSNLAMRIIPPNGKGWCTRCKKFLKIQEFWKNKSRWNGLNGNCKKCHNIERQERRQRARLVK